MNDHEAICKVIEVVNRVEALYSSSKNSNCITIEFDGENQLYKIRDFLQSYIKDRFIELAYNGNSDPEITDATRNKLRQAVDGTEKRTNDSQER